MRGRPAKTDADGHRAGRRVGVAVAILLLVAMIAIALLGLLPHTAKGAVLRPSRTPSAVRDRSTPGS